MNIRTFIAPFLISMFLFFNQIVFLPSQVLATHLPWCGCGYCWMAIYGGCTCGYPYKVCLDDTDPLQLHDTTDNRPTDISSTLGKLTYTAANLGNSGRVTILMRRQGGQECLHTRVTSHLLGNAKSNLKASFDRIY